MSKKGIENANRGAGYVRLGLTIRLEYSGFVVSVLG